MVDRAKILVEAEDRTGAALQSVQNNLANVGKAVAGIQKAFAAVAGAAGIMAFRQEIIDHTVAADNALRRLDATIRAVGTNIGAHRRELLELAEEIQGSTMFDNDQALQAMGTLVKFGNISGDVFKQAVKLSADMAAVMGSDMPSAAQMLGKALQSPTEGLKGLEREFGKLTQSQRDHIESLVTQGRTLEAQKAILEAVRSKVGGVAEEMNTGLSKATRDVTKNWDDFLKALGRTDIIGGSAARSMGAIADILSHWNSLLGETTPLDNYMRKLGEVQEKIDFLQRAEGSAADRRRADAAKLPPGFRRDQLLAPDRELEELRAQERKLSAMVNALGRAGDPSTFDARDLRMRQTNLKPELGGKPTGDVDNTFRDLRQRYDEMLAKVGDLSTAEETALLLETEKYKTLAPMEKDKIMNLAKQIDEKRINLLVDKITYDQEKKGIQDQIEALRKADEEQQKLVMHFREMADPTLKIRLEMEQLDLLLQKGAIDAETWADATVKLSEDMSKATDKVDDSTKKTNETARQLGLTFSSAFEDAILKASKLSDVLKGLAMDVARIFARKAITEPLAEGIGGIFSGGGGDGIMGSIGRFFGFGSDKGGGNMDTAGFDPSTILNGLDLSSAATDFGSGEGLEAVIAASMGLATGGVMNAGGTGGTDSQAVMFRKSPWESVAVGTPDQLGGGGMNITLHVHAGVAQTVRAEMMDLLPTIQRAMRDSVANERMRGGQFAAAFEG
jgi:phage-related minor tail protein